MSRIAYTRPSITDLEVDYATDAARNGWGAQCYDYINRFEAGFAAHLGVPHVIATSSCTGALHMGLSALGIGQGDEVILADTNWIATAAPIAHVGATPVFVDVDPDSWCIDPLAAEAAITPKTRAIIATHIYGNLCDMDALLALADRHGIALIEDAAEAIGSVYKGKRAGSMGRFSTFSFHGTKTMTTGEGGMFATSDAELYETVLTLSNHGRARGQTRQFWPDMIGFKYKISNVQAAIGLAQIERIDELTARKREILAAYKSRLLPDDRIAMNPEPTGVVNGAWMPTVVFSEQTGITQAQAIAAFQAADIDARVFFSPLSDLDFFDSAQTRHAHDIARRAINLPSYHDMTQTDIDRVAEVVRGLMDGAA
ncbi:DegT/DnrJ/EryC1/StrS family aminotransferase [Arenibacterium halophilum]|uniref:DegT/DnrJ/EryC1/StrS aminotransferase family protein n=1 Tax=Arenibacterium halophilum TaxID=2583821 RepID=A0ABY2XC24_9RHOB|nr:DegT/DnrJ/EryC1/StrS family aminotransferase [Arenibacterium halophilum]TMV13509.1 DegT/DnrJ/EryC1/StrS aminotransferase family protein [Arenibacterium halophilum]